MKLLSLRHAAFALLSTLTLTACSSPSSTPAAASAPAPAQSAATSADHGKYLVTVLACTDCHTPFKLGPNGPEPDMARFLSGHPAGLKLPPPPPLSQAWVWAGSGTNTAFAGPWGTTYAINLTPDPTGLGAWTEEMFVQALRTGKHMGTSRQIQPPMPWQAYGKLTDDDIKAVYGYLRTIPAVANPVTPYAPPMMAQ